MAEYEFSEVSAADLCLSQCHSTMDNHKYSSDTLALIWTVPSLFFMERNFSNLLTLVFAILSSEFILSSSKRPVPNFWLSFVLPYFRATSSRVIPLIFSNCSLMRIIDISKIVTFCGKRISEIFFFTQTYERHTESY